MPVERARKSRFNTPRSNGIVFDMETDERIKEGDYVVILHENGRRWMVRAKHRDSTHTHLGSLSHDKLIGATFGSSATSSVGEELWLLRPCIEDFILKAERKTQIVYPKDLGIIVAKTGISAGTKVLEAGTGSGVLTLFMANLVRPTGHVYSYEVREEFLRIAQRNLERSGLSQYVTIKNKDAASGVDESAVDVAVADVGDQWSLVKPFMDALRGSGFFVAISPTMNQVEKVHLSLKENGFVAVESLEVLTRGLEARTGKTRPATRMIGHTAYLTFARKVTRSKA